MPEPAPAHQPLHPQLAAMVEKAARFPPLHKLPLGDLRQAAPRMLKTGLPCEEVASVEDLVLPDYARQIRLRAYRPNLDAGNPLAMFFHGSGFTFCSIETHDAMCRQICNRTSGVVVSVDYSLAPELPYPAAPDDCFAATLWCARNAARFGADARRLAVCGDSAGGTMAAVVALRARDEHGPPIKAQALVYPVTDHYSAGHRSYDERGKGCGLLQADMCWFWDNYLPDAALASHPYVSPVRAMTLKGLPQTYIAVAEYDVLRDEGRAYARALADSSVLVVLRHYDDMNHGFLNWVGVIDRADEAMADMTTWMRGVL
jgi:acetyl esterase